MMKLEKNYFFRFLIFFSNFFFLISIVPFCYIIVILDRIISYFFNFSWNERIIYLYDFFKHIYKKGIRKVGKEYTNHYRYVSYIGSIYEPKIFKPFHAWAKKRMFLFFNSYMIDVHTRRENEIYIRLLLKNFGSPLNRCFKPLISEIKELHDFFFLNFYGFFTKLYSFETIKKNKDLILNYYMFQYYYTWFFMIYLRIPTIITYAIAGSSSLLFSLYFFIHGGMYSISMFGITDIANTASAGIFMSYWAILLILHQIFLRISYEEWGYTLLAGNNRIFFNRRYPLTDPYWISCEETEDLFSEIYGITCDEDVRDTSYTLDTKVMRELIGDFTTRPNKLLKRDQKYLRKNYFQTVYNVDIGVYAPVKENHLRWIFNHNIPNGVFIFGVTILIPILGLANGFHDIMIEEQVRYNKDTQAQDIAVEYPRFLLERLENKGIVTEDTKTRYRYYKTLLKRTDPFCVTPTADYMKFDTMLQLIFTDTHWDESDRRAKRIKEYLSPFTRKKSVEFLGYATRFDNLYVRFWVEFGVQYDTFLRKYFLFVKE